MGRAASNDAPADPKAIMEARRAAYREEQGLPDVKWSCFAEQRKHEDFAAVRPSVERRFNLVLTPSTRLSSISRRRGWSLVQI
mgnify:CR=1 FL=1